MFARLIFAMVHFAARKGLVETTPEASSAANARQAARRTGIRGETYAYWYLRRRGYTVIARNFTFPGIKGEIDMVGYDGRVLAFIEVKTRTATGPGQPSPEDAVTDDERRYLVRIAQRFLRAQRVETAPYRFDVLAIETRTGAHPEVRLHKGAFAPDAK